MSLTELYNSFYLDQLLSQFIWILFSLKFIVIYLHSLQCELSGIKLYIYRRHIYKYVDEFFFAFVVVIRTKM